jgi:hypothetical protein
MLPFKKIIGNYLSGQADTTYFCELIQALNKQYLQVFFQKSRPRRQKEKKNLQ